MKGLLLALALLPLYGIASECVLSVAPITYTVKGSHDVGKEELVFSLYSNSNKALFEAEVISVESVDHLDFLDRQVGHIVSEQGFQELILNNRGDFYIGAEVEEIDFLIPSRLLAKTRKFNIHDLNFDEEGHAFYDFESEFAGFSIVFKKLCDVETL